MRAIVLLSLLSGSVALGQSIEQAKHVLNFDALTPSWQELLSTLHEVEYVAAPFTEARHFKFKTEPQRYTGVFRKASNGAVSLAYEDGSSMALHVGDGYAYYRKGDGPAKAIPDFASKRDSVSLLPSLLGLKLEDLNTVYTVYGRLESGNAWELRLVERPEVEMDLTYEQIDVTGQGPVVETIVLRKGAMRSIEITLESPEFPESFSSEVMEAYFFQP